MNIIIVDRDPVFLAPLVNELIKEKFDVAVVENMSGVLSLIKSKSLHFLVADSSLLVDHSLGLEVRRQSPLTRLIVLAAHPSLVGMIESISTGITDYLPRQAASFGQLVDTILEERDRLVRWQYVILSETLGKGDALERYSTAVETTDADPGI